MKKKLFIFVVFFLFMHNVFCQKNIFEPGAIIKFMRLANDAQKILRRGDPIAIDQIVKKIITEIKYINFNNVTDVQIKSVVNLVVNIALSQRKEIQRGLMLFIDKFIAESRQYVVLFLTNKELQSVTIRLTTQIIRSLKSNMSKNPKMISELLNKLKSLQP